MCILIKVYNNPSIEAPTRPEDLIVCDESDEIIYFDSGDEADAYREKHGISSQIYYLIEE